MSAIGDVIVHDRDYAPSLHDETVVHGWIFSIFESRQQLQLRIIVLNFCRLVVLQPVTASLKCYTLASMKFYECIVFLQIKCNLIIFVDLGLNITCPNEGSSHSFI